MKGILASKMVPVCTVFILLTAVAFFSGTILATRAASAAAPLSQLSSSTTPHALAPQPARVGERSAPATSGGKLLWRYVTGGAVYSTPAVVNGVVYIGSRDGYVYALNASNGTLVWRYLTGNLVVSSPAVVKGVVYIGSDDDYVYALNASNGTMLWRSQPGTPGVPFTSSTAVVSSVVYVGSANDPVYAFTAGR